MKGFYCSLLFRGNSLLIQTDTAVWSTNSSGKLNILLHHSHTLGVNSAKITKEEN